MKELSSIVNGVIESYGEKNKEELQLASVVVWCYRILVNYMLHSVIWYYIALQALPCGVT